MSGKRQRGKPFSRSNVRDGPYFIFIFLFLANIVCLDRGITSFSLQPPPRPQSPIPNPTPPNPTPLHLYTTQYNTTQHNPTQPNTTQPIPRLQDASMHEWEWETGELKSKFFGNKGRAGSGSGGGGGGGSRGNGGGISCLAATGSVVLTAGWDKTVRMWPRSAPAPQSEAAVAAAAAAAAASALASGGRRR